MRRSLELARLGTGQTSPNPMVGCVIVKDGRIVGEGYHRRPSLPHAEAEALASAGADAHGADLYVNLEPCCHFGRTPPCTRQIVGAGIKRVIAAICDPNPKVDGGGIEELRRGGVTVEVGLLSDEARALNEGYLTWVRRHRPLVTLKWAATLDGKVATANGRSRYLTGRESLLRVHEMRRASDAVLVGIGTVLSDDPELTVRHVEGRSPIRIVLDSHLHLPPSARLTATPPETWILTTEEAPSDRARRLEGMGVTVIRVKAGDGRPDLEHAVGILAERGITRLLVEGGPTVHAAFLERSLADRIVAFMAPKILGGRDAPSAVAGTGVPSPDEAPTLTIERVERLGEDVMIEARPKEAM